MGRLEVWYAIPSANPEKCRRTLPVWRDMGYKVAVLQNWRKGDIPADLVVWSDHYPGWPGSINQLCREAVPKSAHVVVSGGDDMLPDPNLTAQEIAEQFFDRFPNGFGVMQPTGDEFMSCQHYCGSPWLGRGWIERANGGRGPMWPDYTHNWADNELHWVAKGLGALWQRDDLTHKHEHFTRTGEAKPDYWQARVAPKDQHDVEQFLTRKSLGFPGHQPLGGGYAYDYSRASLNDGRLAEQHWLRLYSPESHTVCWVDRMVKALRDCAAAGRVRVALYGAGTHTRSIVSALAEPPVEIACIIDDGTRLHGKKLFGFPVVSREQALALRLDAVVLSANSHEDALWERARVFRDSGVEVVRLYEDVPTLNERKIKLPGMALAQSA